MVNVIFLPHSICWLVGFDILKILICTVLTAALKAHLKPVSLHCSTVELLH